MRKRHACLDIVEFLNIVMGVKRNKEERMHKEKRQNERADWFPYKLRIVHIIRLREIHVNSSAVQVRYSASSAL